MGPLLLLTLVWALTHGAPPAHPQSQTSREYEIKAAFLYNFVKFIEWPAEAFPDRNTPITVGILGEDPFGAALDSINGKIVRGRRLVVKRYARVPNLDFPHVLFISSSENGHLAQIVESLSNSSVLTVGETDRFTHAGGIIKFVITNNKVRFHINVDAAERVDLTISSKLLKLATIIRNERSPGKH